MNRRDALIAVLSMPAAVSEFAVKERRDQNGNKIQVLSSQTHLNLQLADEDKEEGGIYGLTVTYKGKQVKITAKEIWDALNETPQTQFKNFAVTP